MLLGDKDKSHAGSSNARNLESARRVVCIPPIAISITYDVEGDLGRQK